MSESEFEILIHDPLEIDDSSVLSEFNYINLICNGKEETLFCFCDDKLKRASLDSIDDLLKINLGICISQNKADNNIVPKELYNEACRIIYKRYYNN